MNNGLCCFNKYLLINKMPEHTERFPGSPNEKRGSEIAGESSTKIDKNVVPKDLKSKSLESGARLPKDLGLKSPTPTSPATRSLTSKHLTHKHLKSKYITPGKNTLRNNPMSPRDINRARRREILKNLEDDFHDSVGSVEEVEHKKEKISLGNLIKDIKRKIASKSPYVSKIKRPNLLVQALSELNQMIGMKRLKESVTLQVIRLIDAMNSNQADLGMLNTILYGDPGVGKTNIGKILAKIWHGLGFLEDNAKATERVLPNISEIPEDQALLIMGFGMVALTYLASGGKMIHAKYGVKGVIIAMVVALVIGLLLASYYMRNSPDIVGRVNMNPENDEVKYDPEADRSIIKVVSRKDFVAEFLGQTAIKTRKLLNANIGKVLFIDEAYSLYQNGSLGGDMYGSEALTEINLFLSENPNKIVVIFAGYENLMKNGIFKAQPGLPRRCMWHFQCDGYDGDQLGDIFLLQLGKKGWSIDNPSKAKELIGSHKDLFPSYGGDTERLIFYSQLSSSETRYRNPDIAHNTLTVVDIEEGLKSLSENNVNKDQHKQNMSELGNDDLSSFIKGFGS